MGSGSWEGFWKCILMHPWEQLQPSVSCMERSPLCNCRARRGGMGLGTAHHGVQSPSWAIWGLWLFWWVPCGCSGIFSLSRNPVPVRNREKGEILELFRAGLADESVTPSKSDIPAQQGLCSAKLLSSGIWRPQMVKYLYITVCCLFSSSEAKRLESGRQRMEYTMADPHQ